MIFAGARCLRRYYLLHIQNILPGAGERITSLAEQRIAVMRPQGAAPA